MNTFEQQQFNFLYQQHLINLKLQGKHPATIDRNYWSTTQMARFLNKPEF